MKIITFEWDDKKDKINRHKHGVSFFEAQRVFLDPHRVIAEDLKHSHSEKDIIVLAKLMMPL